GRVAYSIDGEGDVTKLSYNTSGQVTRIVQFADVNPTSSLPTQAAMDTWSTGATVANNPSNRITRNYYDGAGVLRYTVDGEGYATLRTEDADGRLISVTRYDRQLSLSDADTINSVSS